MKTVYDDLRKKGVDCFAGFGLLTLLNPSRQTLIMFRDKDLLKPSYDSLYRPDGVPQSEAGLSIFSDSIRQVSASQIRKFVSRIPEVDGVLLDIRLSIKQLLAYSLGARICYIQERRIDPIDIDIYSRDSDQIQLNQDWARWRLEKMGEFVAEMVAAARTGNPKRKIVFMGYANFYQWSLADQNFSLNDWLNWTLDHCDTGDPENPPEVILLGNWAEPANADSYKKALNLIAKTGVPIKAIPLLVKKTWKYDKPVTYKEQWDALKKQVHTDSSGTDISRVAVQIESESDLKEVEELFGK